MGRWWWWWLSYYGGKGAPSAFGPGGSLPGGPANADRRCNNESAAGTVAY